MDGSDGGDDRERGDDRAWLPIVVVERPWCGHCGSTRLRVRRVIQQDDGSTLRYCDCRVCSQSTKVVLE